MTTKHAMNIPLEKDLYSPAEVAALLGVSTRSVRNWMAGKYTEHRLKHSRLGRQTRRISRDDLAEFLALHYQDNPEPRVKPPDRVQQRINKVIHKMRHDEATEALKKRGML